MLLKKYKFIMILGIIVGSLFFSISPHSHKKELDVSRLNSFPNTSGNNFDLVDNILDTKINYHNILGYFPQLYQPSLQATYYTLYILSEIGRLSSINQTEMVNYILSCYNPSSHIFIDDYARRYLDTDISKMYYPYTSLLEVNCYALLSISILNSLDLIDIQESIDFIWSCYQPITSGFMGQSYDYWLPDHFKLSTADNTYFAITTLDLLMSDWNGYLTERSDLIQYLESLQSTNAFFWYFGGFENDKDNSLETIDIFEPNLLSSYYCIKALDIFGIVDVINMNNFYQYLGGLYDPVTFSFQMAHFLPLGNYGNSIATSLGLILSDLTSYSSIDRNNVINFILNNRNSKGIWDYSTDFLYCELIDTYQVIRSLSNSGELSQLSEGDKDSISTALTDFASYYGFSLLSEEYTSINLLYAIINTFDLYNRTSDLDYQYLYSMIEDSCVYLSVSDCEGFNAGLIFEDTFRKYRSFPIEYYCSGTQQYFQYVENSLLSHKNTFNALSSLKILEMIDDFEIAHNLNDLLQSILDSQFLENGYDNYGGFLPFLTFSVGTPEYQDKKIFVDYSYYAIKIMELLSDYLGLGDITNLGFDIPVLSSYIHSYIFEDVNYQYFSPGYTMNPATLIENTFYAVYTLKRIGLYDLDEIKVKNFLLDYINYSNIKSVYYTYKLSKILDEDIPLNYDLIYQLIGDIYSEENHEYYLTTDRKKIDQEIVLWVSEMTVEDLSDSSTFINIDHLEGCEFLSTGNNITFTINAKYSGTYWYWIDGILVDSSTFNPDGDTFVYSLDGYTDKIKDYTVKINATALDDTYGEIIAMFSVYSESSTIVNIISLENYEYMTIGHTITFSLHSQYPDCYNFSVDNIEIISDTYYDGQVFQFSIDGYGVETHEVEIWARGLDGKEGNAYSTFMVYSTSETTITIHSIDNYVYNSTGNFINFSISSDFPENYSIEIDGEIVEKSTYISNESILYSIDGYTSGLHWLHIWANSSDKKETTSSVRFDVFTNSFLEIEIRHLNNYEFKSTGNYILFYLNTSFPDSYKLFIDEIEKGSGVYHYGGEVFNYSTDGYFIGDHNISIWANSTDGKEAICKSSFTVYSLSNTIVTIEELPDYEFLTTGHFVKFNISSLYPDYFIISIDGIEINNSDYISGKFYYQSIDGYSTGFHTLSIWAIGEDEKVGTASSDFNVYSNSTTIIVINEIPNYEFMTIGNNINFSISSFYDGEYNVSINDILIDEDLYTVGEAITYSSDGYSVGDHTVLICAKSLDGKTAQYETIFTVYSNSTTLINIHNLQGCEFMSVNNYLNFSIHSSYPDYYTLMINDILVLTDNYSNGEYLLYSLDNYTSTMGNYSVSIWAIGKDGKEGSITAEFSVYSTSVTLINIHNLQGCEFMSIGNYLNFSIHSSYSDYYTLKINDILVLTGNYSDGEYIIYSLDNYTSEIGNYTVSIWAIGKDGKVGTSIAQFKVYSASETIINIHNLQGCEFMSVGNFLNFSVSSRYPDYYTLKVDDVLVTIDNYSNGEYIVHSLDNYTSTIGNHSISIWAIGKDDKVGIYVDKFKVYSASELLIEINRLEDFEFLTTGNELEFTIFSNYSRYYELHIDNHLISKNNYSNAIPIIFSLDNYTTSLGKHTVNIFATSLDGKNSTVQIDFWVYSASEIEITIMKLEDYEFNSTGNELIVNISCKYSVFYSIFIDTLVIDSGNYTEGQLISLPIDDYDIGQHNISIWAKSLDGKEIEVNTTFTVYYEEEIEEEENDEENDNRPNKFKLSILIGSIVMSAFMIAIPTIVIIFSTVYHNKISKRFSYNIKKN
ncbi:MAG: hypothetical protein HWN81_02325 [Candidatus Lokiarchaeota archaeon]|nr:hypothetical protein [Candidatus Lokiarchaeota archaeon]